MIHCLPFSSLLYRIFPLNAIFHSHIKYTLNKIKIGIF